MTNIPPADDGSEIDSELFEDWLDQAADSKGVSKQELMNQMLSSYWILDELTELVGETEANNNTRRLSTENAKQAPEDESQDTERQESIDITPDKKSDESEPKETASSDDDVTEKRIREIQMAIQKLVEHQSTGETQRPVDESPDTSSPESEEPGAVSDLQQHCETLDSKLEDLESRQDSQFDRLSDELQLVLDRVNELEHEQDQFADKENISAIAEDIRTIDGRLEELRTADQELESRMDREFDSIEELFRRVLNAFDNLESELETTAESYQEELEPLKKRETDRKKLEGLKTDALKQGVRKGSCERCDQTVDLGLLESPDCPNCAARFTGIDDSGWNPFRPATLETGPVSTDG
jgi:hypothetical protein